MAAERQRPIPGLSLQATKHVIKNKKKIVIQIYVISTEIMRIIFKIKLKLKYAVDFY